MKQQRLITSKHLLPLLIALLAMLANAGCSKQKLIPNTKVMDTALNREILRVVEKYRKAVGKKDQIGIIALVHPTYQDHGGTPEGTDDIDFIGLKKLLKSRFLKTSKIRMRIEYKSVGIKGREASVDTYIDATFVYNQPGTNLRWRRLTDFNRFRLIKEKKRWQFISGL